MKTNFIFSLVSLLIGFSSYSQEKENLIREIGSSSWIYYKDKNWDDKLPENSDKQLNYGNPLIDPTQINKIAHEEISSGYYDQLNKTHWFIRTKVSSDGQIVSVLFLFKEDPIIDPSEFKNLSARIKKEIEIKIFPNKKISDLFYFQSTLPGPKF